MGLVKKVMGLARGPLRPAGMAEHRFRSLIDADADGMVVVDQEGIIRFVNPAAEIIFAQHESEMIGRPFSYPVTPHTTTELEIRGPDDRSRFAEMRVNPIEWEGSKANLASIRDITELKKMEQLKVELSETRRLDKLKDEFIGTVSHELRTPLTIIKAAVSNLADGVVGSLNERQVKVLATTRRNIDRLGRLIEDLLDLSRLKSGRAQMRPRRIFTAPLIRETVMALQAAAEEKNVVIAIDLEEGLPPLYADPDMLVQVLGNLLQNALRFAQRNVVVKARAVAGEPVSVEVMVGDDGPGIPKGRQVDLFKKFVQLDRPPGGDGYKGTGLGLAICKEIVEWHEGTIWAESDAGRGARFFFRMPQASDGHAFKVALRDAIQASEEKSQALGVLSIAIQNLGELIQVCGDDSVQTFIHEFEEKIRCQLLRRGDHLFLEPEGVFLVILAETGQAGANSVAARIDKLAAASPCQGRGVERTPQLKIGVALFPEDGQDGDQLLAAARSHGSEREVTLAQAHSDRR